MLSSDKYTEDKLEELENNITQIFKRAEKEVNQKMLDYLDKFKKQDEVMLYKFQNKIITEQEYYSWRQSKITAGKRYANLLSSINQELVKASDTAYKYINGDVPQIFAVNYNTIAEIIRTSDVSIGYSFNVVDKNVIAEMIERKELMLPPSKKTNVSKMQKWNNKHVNAEILQGILQGESIPKIAQRLQNVCGSNRAVAIRNARTMITASQNSGRIAGFRQVESDGVIMKKVWIATEDSRTRKSHLSINNEMQDNDKPFSNGLMFPGDWSGRPEEVYNCRCTLGAEIIGFKSLKQEQIEQTNYEDYSFDYDIEGRNDVEECINNMSTSHKELWKRNIENTEYTIIESDGENVEHYSPSSGVVNLFNTSSADTLFHETSHAIDENIVTLNYRSSRKEKRFGEWKEKKSFETQFKGASNTASELYNINRQENYNKDISALYNWIGIKHDGATPLVEHDEITKAIRQSIENFKGKYGKEVATNLSDMIDAATYGEHPLVFLTGGHGKDYWTDDTKAFKELWAEVSSLKALGHNEALEEISKILPERYKAINTVHEAVYDGKTYKNVIRNENDRRIQEEIWEITVNSI